MAYKLFKTFRGYKIAKTTGKTNIYVEKFYNGRFYWSMDHAYAKVYTLATAKKHLETLRGNCKNVKIL